MDRAAPRCGQRIHCPLSNGDDASDPIAQGPVRTMSRRNLVTGGGGFIGRHLVRRLTERGESVRVLDIAGAADLPASVEVIQGSVLDGAALDQAIAGVERVYHLAANPNLWHRNPRVFGQVNHEGTRQVLAAAARAGVRRIVYTSTESILKSCRTSTRNTRNAYPVNETVSLDLADMPGPYCRSKYAAEQEALAAARDGLPVVIVNPTMPIGPGDLNLTPPSRMLLGFVNGSTPAYLDCAFNLVDVRDVAWGHILAADLGRTGERYILGGKNIRLKALLRLLSEVTGLPMPRWQVPYGVAVGVAAAEAVIAAVTGRPPTAPLAGVRLARTPALFDCSKADIQLGLTHRPLHTSLVDAVLDFAARGLLRRLPQRPLRADQPSPQIDADASAGAAAVRRRTG
jgi:dihydroflavonol-4-reductase